MTDFPLPRVLEFLRGVTPFDTLDPAELAEVASRMEMGYFPRGEVILKQGGPASGYLYIIQHGSARVTVDDGQGGEILVDVRGEGDFFGALSLLKGTQALFEVRADEDLIALMLAAEHFRPLVDAHPTFQRYYGGSLARNIQAVRKAADSQLPQMTGLESLNLDAAMMRARVEDLMTADVLVCLPATPIHAAAHRMAQRQVGSIVVVQDNGHPLGIVTDTDLRVRVVAASRSFDAPVVEIITRPLHTIDPEAYAFEALLEMSRHDIHHLLVCRDDRMVGVICDHDLQSLTGSSPVGVVRDIAKVDSIDGLVEVHRRVDRVLETLLRMGGRAQDMTELVTEFNDRLTRKLIELTEIEMDNLGLGRPPVPYCWVALGSEGRREQTLRTDQDNALMYANLPRQREERAKQWFLDFSERVVEGLVRCGFPRCLGGIMASNPQWCLSESGWQHTFARWVAEPSPETLRMGSIFFDFRDIYSEADFIENLSAHLLASLEGNRQFLRFMAKNGLYNRPPLGFLRQFVVEKDGDHKNKLDLKLSGLTPMVDAARVLALEQGVLVTSTLSRLREVHQRGIIKDALYEDLVEAFSFITILRIRHHLEARAEGEVPDNFVNPADLNKLQRKMLKESFAAITRLQELMEHRFQTWLVT